MTVGCEIVHRIRLFLFDVIISESTHIDFADICENLYSLMIRI